ncbi:MAG: GDSL family lipase [Clostridia bacterium]|nr:GDSL family lipase [Clostridia bacterium]
MHIKDKIGLDLGGLIEHGPVNLVAFGDSVTHGSVGPGEYDYESVYWSRLKRKLSAVNLSMPVNAIDAGINGITAKASLGRIERDVLSHHPDLVIVCFGLNDVNGTLDEYLSSLREIFSACRSEDRDTVFMTPNMLNTYVAPDAPKEYLSYAAVTAEYQNGGRMDRYMKEACDLAQECGITVCDCYGAWKKRAETEDTTLLLANRINHPVREMHELFSSMLFDTIMGR